MFKKFISMATAVLLLASGVSIVSANTASAVSTTIAINCDDTSLLTSANGWETVGQFGGSRYATFGAGFQKFVLINPSDVYTINITGCGIGHVVAPANASANTLNMSSTGFWSSITGSTFNTRTNIDSPASLIVTGGSSIPSMPVSGGRNYLMVKNDNDATSEIAITFVDSTTWSNANLSSMSLMSGSSPVTLSPSFSASTTSYTASTSNSSVSASVSGSVFGNPTSTSCNSTLLANSGSSCSLNSGSNTLVVTVTALDGSTKSYTVTVSSSGGGGGAPTIATTSTIAGGAVNPVVTLTSSGPMSAMFTDWTFGFGTTGLALQRTNTAIVGTIVLTFRGTASNGTLTIQGKNSAFFPTASAASNTLSFVITGGTSPAPSTPTLTAAEIAANAAAAAKAAAEAAAAVRAAEVAAAQTKLSTVLKADQAGTIDEYKSANINISTSASLARINAEVLKLSANDRADFAKIKAIADKIEFDESFFNATARPTLSTYAKYEVVGVTERILPTINTKVLELPATLRADAKAIQDLVKVESFVDQVANTQTRSTVTAAALVSRGLLVADYPRRYSVVRGLGAYPEGSLNTMAKIEAAIKAEIAKAEAPKLRLAEIKARIAARKK
jgi:hypothetical protein